MPAPLTDSSFNVAEIEEPCAHDLQFGGMCANCGKDMTQYALAPLTCVCRR